MTDSDTSGTLGSLLTVNGSAGQRAVALNASTDVLRLSYGGLAILPATIAASSGGATASGIFAPTLSPIVYSGPTVGGMPELDLYAPAGAGAGSTASFTASEVGWSTPPYNQAFAVVGNGCQTIGTATATAPASFTFTTSATPAAGSCSLTIEDGVNQTAAVKVTYSTTAFPAQ